MNGHGANRRGLLAGALCVVLTMMLVHGISSAQAITWPWSQLTRLQKDVLAPFKDQWNGWSTAEKRSWVLLANRFPRLGAQEQERARVRIAQWATLSPAQRETARASIRLFRDTGPGERQAEWQRYQQMTQEQKAVLRNSGRLSATGSRSGVRSGLASDAAQPFGQDR